jgi:hypothetical protein
MPSFYSYARAERALAYAFEIPDDQRNRITGKIKALMKQGLGASERHPGMRAEYSQDDIDRLAIATALLNSAIDPQIAARAIGANWQRAKGATKPVTSLQEICAKARAIPNDDDEPGERGLFLTLMLHAVRDTAEPLLEGEHDETKGLVTIGYLRPLDHKRTGEPKPNWQLFFSKRSGSATRVAIPLSLLIHRLDYALNAPQGALLSS